LSIIQLFVDASPDDPLVPDLAMLYKNDPQQYAKNARNWTLRFAEGPAADFRSKMGWATSCIRDPFDLPSAAGAPVPTPASSPSSSSPSQLSSASPASASSSITSAASTVCDYAAALKPSSSSSPTADTATS